MREKTMLLLGTVLVIAGPVAFVIGGLIDKASTTAAFQYFALLLALAGTGMVVGSSFVHR